MTDMQGCGPKRYFARILLDHLPPWLEQQIRGDRLSILDWNCAEGEAVDCLRRHFPESRIAGIDRSPEAVRRAGEKFGASSFFHLDAVAEELPVDFDISFSSHILQDFADPWTVLRKIGRHTTRHLLALVPFRGERQPYRFDDSTIGTRIDPDFVLSSARVIGSEILLVYSRAGYVPVSGAKFDETAAPEPMPACPREPAPQPTPAAEPDDAAGDPIETVILPALRQARSIAVVTCAIPFSSALNQRPIGCARYLADQGTTVLFAELWECPEQAIHRTGEEVYPGVFSIPVYAFREDIRDTFEENLRRLAAACQAPRSYLCTIPSRELVAAADVLRSAGFQIHYDIMDDWEAFLTGDEEMTHWFSAPVEMQMIARADTVTAVSEKLARKFRRLRDDIAVVRNGYQPAALACEQFAAARTPLEGPKVVGYFGHLSDAWFDWQAVFHAARERPALQFELIGYGLSEASRLRLSTFANIRHVGLVPQKDLEQYARKWWAGMIPFVPSTLSAAVDPLKIYEYLHFGLPTVVTGISGVDGYPMVRLAGNPQGFVAALDGLPERPDEQTLAETAEFLKTCVWEARLAPLREMMGRLSGESEIAGREAVLESDADYWQSKAEAFERRLEAALGATHGLDEKVQELTGRVEWFRAENWKLQEQREQQGRLAAEQRARQDARWEAQLAAREAALTPQIDYWQAKSAELGRQLEAELRRFEEAAREWRAKEEKAAAENRSLAARAAASAEEAANLRRLTSDLLRSYSWKLTAPLRAVSRPFFPSPSLEAPAAAEPATAPEPEQAVTTAAPASTTSPLLAELRRARPLMVIPCAVPFRSSFNQRPISMARYLADRGATVLYVALESSEPAQEVYPRVFHMPAAAFQAHFEDIAALRGTYLCTLPNAALLENARGLRAGGYHIHYDIMDDWEEFHRSGEAPWYAAAVEREMVEISATVSAISGKLAQKFAPVRGDIAVIPNGYDPATLDCPQFAAAHAPLGRKMVGYFGHLSDAWFDWEAVLEASRVLPGVEFQLIGYGLSDRSRARLADYPNIRFEGLAAHSDLHRFARNWWAAMIPFRAGELSAAVDPLKVYEYLHFGLPTVVTGVAGIAGYPLVRFAGNREAFRAAIEQVEARPEEHTLAEVAEFLKTCTWKERLTNLNRLIYQPAARASR